MAGPQARAAVSSNTGSERFVFISEEDSCFPGRVGCGRAHASDHHRDTIEAKLFFMQLRGDLHWNERPRAEHMIVYNHESMPSIFSMLDHK